MVVAGVVEMGPPIVIAASFLSFVHVKLFISFDGVISDLNSKMYDLQHLIVYCSYSVEMFDE